jgi:hypothetical protein
MKILLGSLWVVTADMGNRPMFAACFPTFQNVLYWYYQDSFSSSAKWARGVRSVAYTCRCIWTGRPRLSKVGLPECLRSERFHLYTEVPIVCAMRSFLCPPSDHWPTQQWVSAREGEGCKPGCAAPGFLERKLKKGSKPTKYKYQKLKLVKKCILLSWIAYCD